MPKPPRQIDPGDIPGSSAEEIENEPVWGKGHNHRIGYKNNLDRVPGLVPDGSHWESEAERHLAEDAIERYRKLRERYNRGDLLNFQDIMLAQTDFHSHDESNYPLNWHFVINASEDFVKYKQDWPANIKQREQREHTQASQNREEPTSNEERPQPHQDDDTEKDKDREQRSDNDREPDDEEEWRQNRGSESSTKHHAAYSQKQPGQHDTEAEYQRLRKKYTPQEIALLRTLQHEKEYMHTLRQNDGKAVSPVKVIKRHAIGIDKQDTMTPDNWIPRSDNLIRLTGQHPMNAEPKFTTLFDAGLITPNEWHYVRNHGAVPRLFWETHILDVNNGAMQLTMNDIANRYEPINIAMVMACDGVRRGELNKILKSKGFTWGPGAMSNAYWKGARLADVLADVDVPPGDQLYVHFEGADEPSEGKYATSIPFEYATDPLNDVILAYEMNNTKLPPDHGYPIRVVIPGYVGGRCVKWLSRIWISDKENDSHYHIWDNRVLPTFITEQDGEFAQAMFHHPDTACYEQNLNSVVAKPAHGEVLDPESLSIDSSYRLQGIAYDGGGHKVQRVEVSLDEGETWLYAIRKVRPLLGVDVGSRRKFPDQPVRHGKKFWTWCFWHVDVDALHLCRAESIVVRAFNVFKNTQPRNPIWNIMGMMNNCWYRVKIDVKDGKLTFRHPVDVAKDDGWMKPSTENQLTAARQRSSVPNKQFTRQEVERHDKSDDAWIVVDNIVYNVTSVLSWHPGGPATIRANAGKLSAQITSAFNSIHDEYAHKKLQECAIGRLTEKAQQFIQTEPKEQESNGFLVRSRWKPIKLEKRKQLSSDTFQYTFRTDTELGLGTCQHVELGIHMRDKMLVRQYTPVRPVLESEEDGTFDLVLKTYFPDKNQPGGAFSTILHELAIGQTVMVSGPSGEIVYEGNGHFTIEGKDRFFEKVNLILGGSGITPGYQLLDRVMQTQDKTQIRVVDANKTENDILLKTQMDDLEQRHQDQLKITHVLSHPNKPDAWSGESGHVNAEVLKAYCFAPEEKVICLLCGPPAMIQKAVIPALKEWGFEEEKDIFGF